MAVGKSPGERVLLELEPLASAAVQAVTQAERAKLSQWQQEHIVLDAYLGERWAVFDWYIPGATQKDAYVVVRASVERHTKEVVVEPRPAPASRPKRTLVLTAYAIFAPFVVTALFLLLIAALKFLTGDGWPPISAPMNAAPTIWVMSQLMVCAILYQAVSSIPIMLPDGKLLFVNRVWLKKARRTERS